MSVPTHFKAVCTDCGKEGTPSASAVVRGHSRRCKSCAHKLNHRVERRDMRAPAMHVARQNVLPPHEVCDCTWHDGKQIRWCMAHRRSA